MDIDVTKIVLEAASGTAKSDYEQALRRELFPDAFANEHSWLRVKAALELQEKYIREYVTEALTEIVKQLSD